MASKPLDWLLRVLLVAMLGLICLAVGLAFVPV